MTFSFLLRFQEPCEESEADVTCGTETMTKSELEGRDADPALLSFRSIPSAVNAGTATSTLVQGEQADADRHSANRTIPILSVMGTTTKTAIQLESDDQDPRQKDMTVLPRCSSF